MSLCTSRFDTIRKPTKNYCGRKRNPPTSLLGMQFVTDTEEKCWRLLKKLHMELPYIRKFYPIHILQGNHKSVRLTYRNSHCSGIHNSQNGSHQNVHPQMNGKEDVVQIHSGLLQSHNKEWNNAICSDMDVPGMSKLNVVREWRQISYDFTFRWSLKIDSCKLIC